jgi:Holliday junction DNA helicase RuvA
MIAYLQGKIIHKSEQQIILQTGSIGYQVFISKRLGEKIQAEQEIELFIYTKVREDEISLFGFPTLAELDFFKLLITVNGIGPKIAQEVLNQEISATQNAILQGNTLFLSKVPGIGKKSAERLVLELKNKIVPVTLEEMSNLPEENFEEVFDALATLGYNRYQVNHVLRKLPSHVKSTEEIVTYFLQNV